MQNIVSIIAGTLLLLAILAGVFLLTWHGDLTGGAALGVTGTIIGIAGGALAVHTGVNAGARAANATPVAVPTNTTARLPE